MPHFRNFHGVNFSKNKLGDLAIDQETITASNRFDDLGIDQETITADKGVDELFFADELTILVQDSDDELYLKAPTGNDTINADEPVDELFDLLGFGETPPLDMSYEVEMNTADGSNSFDMIYEIGL